MQIILKSVYNLRYYIHCMFVLKRTSLNIIINQKLSLFKTLPVFSILGHCNPISYDFFEVVCHGTGSSVRFDFVMDLIRFLGVYFSINISNQRCITCNLYLSLISWVFVVFSWVTFSRQAFVSKDRSDLIPI